MKDIGGNKTRAGYESPPVSGDCPASINRIIEKLIRTKMRGGTTGVRKKNDSSRRWFEDKDCERVRWAVLRDYQRLDSENQYMNGFLIEDLGPSYPALHKIDESFVSASFHRHCLELVREKEAAEAPIPEKLDTREDLDAFFQKNDGEKFIVDWIYRNKQDAREERHKNLRGLNTIRKRFKDLPSAFQEDMYSEEMLQLVEAVRKQGPEKWRGEYGAASIFNYLNSTLGGIRADLLERIIKDRSCRRFDLTRTPYGSAAGQVVAGPGDEGEDERLEDASGEDEKFAGWIESTYWPDKIYEKKDLFEKAFNASEYDPGKSYRENIRQATKKKTLRFIGILQQKFGEDWDDKEIAEFWAPGKYEKQEKNDFIKYVESFGLKYIGHRLNIEARADLVKGIIKRQKLLIGDDLERLGYITPPADSRFPDKARKLFYCPIKRTDKERTEPKIPKIGEFYFKGKGHFRSWQSLPQPRNAWDEYQAWIRIKEELARGIKEYLKRGGTVHNCFPADMGESKFSKEKTGVYSKHFDLLKKAAKIRESHAAKYRVCVKCGKLERAGKMTEINGLAYCPPCRKGLRTWKNLSES